MAGADWMIPQTLEAPDEVRSSISDPGSVILYYRRYTQTPVGDKYMCVVVKVSGEDAFVITAYMTDILKEGEII